MSCLVRAVPVVLLSLAVPALAAPAPSKVDETDKLFLEGVEAEEGDKIDEVQARKLYLKAAVRGHDVAAVAAAWMAFHGDGGEMDRPGALKMIQKALPGLRKRAEAGEGRAQELLGALLSEGVGVEKDVKEA